MQSLKEMGQQVEAAPDQQISLTDPDARSMATSGKGTGIVGYNVQMAVEAEHHLIVAHEVTNVGNDRTQLLAMGQQAQDVMACEEITALADRGYYNGDEVLACEGTGVLPCVPKTLTSGNTKRGLFTGQDFVYDAEHDHYTCPAGQHLTKGKVRSDRRDNIDHYRNLTACSACALKPRCTPDKHKRVKRWEHEDVLDRMQARLERMPEAMTHPTADGGASVWDHQGLDGQYAFPDEDPGEGQNRDEPARAGLQPEADDQHPGCRAPAEGSRSLTPHARPCAPSRHPQNSAHHPHAGNSVFTRPRSNAVIARTR